jgi:predicted ATP-grasp superfamily ATP-dependent carboligase
MGLVIAPDHLIARYTQILEQHTHNLGCGFMTAALCANKVQVGKILRLHDIPVPDEASAGWRVIKPVRGCGAQGVRLSEGPTGNDEFSQEYIEGEHFSVSIVASRVVGDACLYFSGKPPLVLAVNRQYIDINADGTFRGGKPGVRKEARLLKWPLRSRCAWMPGCRG